MRLLASTLAAVVTALSFPIAATAQDAASVEAQEPADVASPPTPAPIRWVAQVAYDVGQEWTGFSAIYSDGSETKLNFNEGISVGVGASVLPLADGLLDTQITLGFEYAAVRADDQSVRWLAFPLEAIEFVNLPQLPVRAGVGISLLLGPSLKSKNVSPAVDAKFSTSLGFLAELDWVWPIEGSPRGAKLTAGVRYEIQKLKLASAGFESDANAFGILGGVTF